MFRSYKPTMMKGRLSGSLGAGLFFLLLSCFHGASEVLAANNSARGIPFLYAWLEEPKKKEQNADTIAMVAFRDPNAGNRPAVVLFKPEKRKDDSGSFSQVKSPFLNEVMLSQFAELPDLDGLRNALRTKVNTYLFEGPRYAVNFRHVELEHSSSPIRLTDPEALSKWNSLLAQRNGTPAGQQHQPVWLLHAKTETDGRVTIALTQDLLLFRKETGTSSATETEVPTSSLEAMAVDLLAALAKLENNEPMSIDLRESAVDGDSGPCARLFKDLSTQASRPLDSEKVLTARESLRKEVLGRIPAQLALQPTDLGISWNLDNRGFTDAQISKVSLQDPGSSPRVEFRGAMLPGCSRTTALLTLELKDEREKKSLQNVTTFYPLRLGREPSGGGWSLEIGRTEPAPRIESIEATFIPEGHLIRLDLDPLGRFGLVVLWLKGLGVKMKFVPLWAWRILLSIVLLGVVAVITGWIWRWDRKRRDSRYVFRLLEPEEILEPGKLTTALLQRNEVWYDELRRKLGWWPLMQLKMIRQDKTLLARELDQLLTSRYKLLEARHFPISALKSPGRQLLRGETQELLYSKRDLLGAKVERLNRLLLEDLFPNLIVGRDTTKASTEELPAEVTVGRTSEPEQEIERVEGASASQSLEPGDQLEPESIADQNLIALRTQITTLQRELDAIKIDKAKINAAKRRAESESQNLKKTIAARDSTIETLRAKVKDKGQKLLEKDKSLGAKERELREKQQEKRRLDSRLRTLESDLSRKEIEVTNAQATAREQSAKVDRWQKAFKSIDREPEAIASRLHLDGEWLSSLTGVLKHYFRAGETRAAIEALDSLDRDRLREALDAVSTAARERQSILVQMLQDFGREQVGSDLVYQAGEMTPCEVRSAYHQLREKRDAFERLRKHNPRVAHVVWIIDSLQQVAESLERMADEKGADVFAGTLLEPLPLATFLRGSAEEAGACWNGILQKAAESEPAAAGSSQALGRFLDWFLDGERLKALTNVLRLAQVLDVYFDGSLDPEIGKLYENTIAYREVCVELQKRFEWIGVRFAPITFLTPPRTEQGWPFDENGDGRPLIFKSYTLQELAVGRVRSSREDLTRAVGDISAWGFRCDDYPDLRSDTRGWLCRGWRTL